MSGLSELEQAIGLAFSDKSLLQRALVHRSYLNEHPEFALEDNERLEFLGDAVLDFVTGAYLYHHFPEMAEGPLTSLRSALVRRDTLAGFARRYGLGQHLLMGVGEAASGGRDRPQILCSTFEALIGALYLDQGLETVRSLVEPLMAPKVAQTLREELDRDAKSRLQEAAQASLHQTPRYRTVEAAGPDHAKVFKVQVTVGSRVLGEGTGRNKQEAAQRAAAAALRDQALAAVAASPEEAESEA